MTSEKLLLRQLRETNVAAFRTLFDQYAPLVYRFAMGYLKDKTEAEQVVCQVFVALWEKRWTLNDNLSLNGYLFTMTYHRVLATFRQLHSVCRSQEILQRLTTRSGSHEEEQLLFDEWEKAYQEGITRLPLRQRMIYLLSHHEGLSESDIAYRLNMPLKLVVDELSRAVDRISKNFEQTV